GRVDRGVLVVVEDAEELVEPHVDRRGLDHARLVRVQAHAARLDLGEDVTIRKQHGDNLPWLVYGRTAPPSGFSTCPNTASRSVRVGRQPMSRAMAEVSAHVC